MPDIPLLRVAFLDFEASSLAPDRWPIEVGLSWIDRNLKVQTYHSLIQLVPDWPEHAGSPASAVVHYVTEVAEQLPGPWVAASRYPKRLRSSGIGLIDC